MEKTLLFGPMKPVGLEDPETGKRPYAVVQLRQDDAAGTLYNIVGFQTHLKWGAQKEVLQLIPGLENVKSFVMVLCIVIRLLIHHVFLNRLIS